MTHDEALRELLYLYVDGELAPDERRRVERLLESDVSARRIVEDVTRIQKALQQTPPAPPGFLDRVMHEAPVPSRWRLPAGLVAAAAVTLAMWTFPWWGEAPLAPNVADVPPSSPTEVAAGAALERTEDDTLLEGDGADVGVAAPEADAARSRAAVGRQRRDDDTLRLGRGAADAQPGGMEDARKAVTENVTPQAEVSRGNDAGRRENDLRTPEGGAGAASDQETRRGLDGGLSTGGRVERGRSQTRTRRGGGIPPDASRETGPSKAVDENRSSESATHLDRDAVGDSTVGAAGGESLRQRRSVYGGGRVYLKRLRPSESERLVPTPETEMRKGELSRLDPPPGNPSGPPPVVPSTAVEATVRWSLSVPADRLITLVRVLEAEGIQVRPDGAPEAVRGLVRAKGQPGAEAPGSAGPITGGGPSSPGPATRSGPPRLGRGSPVDRGPTTGGLPPERAGAPVAGGASQPPVLGGGGGAGRFDRDDGVEYQLRVPENASAQEAIRAVLERLGIEVETHDGESP